MESQAYDMYTRLLNGTGALKLVLYVYPSNRSRNMMQARVRWFNRRNGFGFIELDDGSKAFIHLCSMDAASADYLMEGDRVSLYPSHEGITRIRKL